MHLTAVNLFVLYVAVFSVQLSIEHFFIVHVTLFENKGVPNTKSQLKNKKKVKGKSKTFNLFDN